MFVSKMKSELANINKVKRIMIIGNIASGKSTLAKYISQITNIDVFHLDKYYFKSKKDLKSNKEWELFLNEIVKRESWIIDGNYPKTLMIRAINADLIIILDPSIFVCYFHFFKRNILNMLNIAKRNDSPYFEFDLFEFDIYKKIILFKTKRKGYYSNILNTNKTIIYIKSMHELKAFMFYFNEEYNASNK